MTYNVGAPQTPMARHLTSPRVGIISLAHEAKHKFARRHAQAHHQRQIPVVGDDPIHAALKRKGRPYLRRLVTDCRDVERYLSLAVEDPRSLVESTREQDEPVHLQ